MTKTQLVKQLKEHGLWEKHYAPIVEKLFEIEELYKMAIKSIKTDGINLQSDRGWKKNPAVDLAPALLREWRTYAGKLKMSPGDAKTEVKEADDGFDDILKDEETTTNRRPGKVPKRGSKARV